jgi:flagellar hook-associated protein 1
MRSTFHGLETARRGMFTQQSALYTTGHNIANANTPGYSRQRVNFEQTEPYPTASLNRPQIPGQMGTGVKAGSVQRVRESFLDLQFRGENNKLGYYEVRSEALKKMEEIMNEPSEEGLAHTMNRFWESLQDLASNPEDDGARLVVAQRGQAVAETFNYLYTSLTRVKEDLKSEIEVTKNQINTLLKQINDLNKQISEIEPHGYLPNDLYDERDRLVDELSKLVNIRVTKQKPTNYGNALPIAEGLYQIELMDKDMAKSHGTLVDTTTFSYNTISVNYTNVTVNGNQIEVIQRIDISNGAQITSFDFFGKLQGLIDSFGYKDSGGNATGTYPKMLNDLDQFAYAFAEEFNHIHRSGRQYNSNVPGSDFFLNYTSAKTIQINPAIMSDPKLIAAAKLDKSPGDGSNAQALADISKRQVSTFNNAGSVAGMSGTLESFYQGVIGSMAVESQEMARMSKNTEVLTVSVENRRQSVSGVSLDEEMTNMIKFQHAYNAAARQITAIDEMLDKIINGMGVVGR